MVAAISAVAAAFIALGLGIWDRIETRSANANSVVPLLSTKHPIVVVDGVKQRSLTIVNDGLGPARVEKIEFTVNDTGKKISVSDMKLIFSEFDLNAQQFSRSSMSLPIFLRPGESLVLFSFKYPESQSARDKIESIYIKMLCQLSLHIEYRSLYDVRDILDEQHLFPESCK
ncbi:hypothetical protein [Pseudomonas halotolerans]|uniref:hypothetical protein n=1 Tax=Pseudomonas halotolerans TaxID=3143552 RepID=UPI0031E40016